MAQFTLGTVAMQYVFLFLFYRDQASGEAWDFDTSPKFEMNHVQECRRFAMRQFAEA